MAERTNDEQAREWIAGIIRMARDETAPNGVGDPPSDESLLEYAMTHTFAARLRSMPEGELIEGWACHLKDGRVCWLHEDSRPFENDEWFPQALIIQHGEPSNAQGGDGDE